MIDLLVWCVEEWEKNGFSYYKILNIIFFYIISILKENYYREVEYCNISIGRIVLLYFSVI